MSPQKLVVLILRQTIIEISINSVKHLINSSFIKTALQPHDSSHKLLFTNLSFISIVSHSKDVSENHSHIFSLLIKPLNNIDHVIDGTLLFYNIIFLHNSFLTLFILLILQSLIDLFFLFEMILK